MAKSIKNNVYWVGKVDWELRKFHGDEYSTHKGSSYNSYLIREGKTVLIDTVWKPFSKEFVKKLSAEIDLKKIDLIVANHAEIDHSGSFPDLMEIIPDTPIYCTNDGIQSLKGHYHKDWNFIPIKTGDKISVGNGKELIFVELKMLHWPDSMGSYLTGDNILFPNDAFGQHYATEFLFNDLVKQDELFAECIKYYANILTPFSMLVNKKINEVLSLGLPIDIICPSHGVVWRKDPIQIVNKYLEWSDNYQEDQITIIYDTMWESTKKMAEAIAEGIKRKDAKTNIKLYNVAISDINDMVTEVFRSKMVIAGSSTINNGMLSGMAGLIEMIKGLKFKNKKAACFGSYGWSGESVKILTEEFRRSGFEIVSEGLKVLWNPDEEAIKKCIEFGAELAGK